MVDIQKATDYAARVAKAKATRDAKKAAREAALAAAAPPEPVVEKVEPSPQPTSGFGQSSMQPRPQSRTRADGRLEVMGRNGEVLARTRVQVGDIFEIPADMIPKGWTYQWNAVSIAGNSDILLDQNHMMFQNGWRPVPAERYAGTLVPVGSKGNIIRGQQLLMERPKALTDEAKAEDERNARQLISDRNESLKLAGVKKAMPDGFAMAKGQYRGTGGEITMKIDAGLDIPRPQHQLADPDE